METVGFEPGYDKINRGSKKLRNFLLYLTFYFLWILHGQLLERGVPFLVGADAKTNLEVVFSKRRQRLSVAIKTSNDYIAGNGSF